MKQRVTAEELREGLRDLGARLREQYGQSRVRVGETVQGGELPFQSPLSWKNGVWHHAVPVSLDLDEPAEVSRRVLQIMGPIVAGVPVDDVPVVVAVLPHSPDALTAARNGQRALAKYRENLSIVEVGHDDEHRFDELAKVIRADIEAHLDDA